MFNIYNKEIFFFKKNAHFKAWLQVTYQNV